MRKEKCALDSALVLNEDEWLKKTPKFLIPKKELFVNLLIIGSKCSIKTIKLKYYKKKKGNIGDSIVNACFI